MLKQSSPIGNGSTPNKVEEKPQEIRQIGSSAPAKETEQVKPQSEAPKQDAPKAEPTKLEIKEQLKEEKPAFNLERTIKLALDLNRSL